VLLGRQPVAPLVGTVELTVGGVVSPAAETVNGDNLFRMGFGPCLMADPQDYDLVRPGGKHLPEQ